MREKACVYATPFFDCWFRLVVVVFVVVVVVVVVASFFFSSRSVVLPRDTHGCRRLGGRIVTPAARRRMIAETLLLDELLRRLAS